MDIQYRAASDNGSKVNIKKDLCFLLKSLR